MKNGSGNSSEEKKNVINQYVNDSKSSWFSQSQKNDWRQSSKRRTQENRDWMQLLERHWRDFST